MCKVSSSLHFVKRPLSGSHSSESYWVPNTDVYASSEGLIIKVELAGMRREDLELVIEGNQIKISGHRPDGCRAPNCKFLVMEINYGAFESVLEVPEGYELTQAKAAYQNGFLRIDVPLKAAKSAPAKISVPISTEKE